MASSTAGGHCFLLALLLLSSAAFGQLSQDFYAKSCPSLDTVVTKVVSAAVTDPPPKGELRMGASLLRLFFHDCFVQGCDASVLLDMDPTNGILFSEKDARPNMNSLRGFDVIDRIKAAVQKECPRVDVSCADILALAARAAVVALKGPAWPLRLGRRDSTTANQTAANNDLPSPSSNLDTLIAAFSKKGFNEGELVALSGAHTIGVAKCQFNQARCPVGATTAPLDEKTPTEFDKIYYGNLLVNRGLLQSDQVLTSRIDVKTFVDKYNSNQTLFLEDFKRAMTKMSELGVLTGANGQVRTKCNRVN